MVMRNTLLAATCALALFSAAPAFAQSINAGDNKPNPVRPFTAEAVAEFETPWAIAELPDNRLLVTEKEGKLFLVTPAGQKTPVSNIPAVDYDGQNGLLDIAPAPDFAQSSTVYLTYVAPSDDGSRLTLASATLSTKGQSAALTSIKTIWQQSPAGGGGQPGGIIAFDPAGKHLFLSVGDRMKPDSAQDEKQGRGKILRLNLDGSTPDNNPRAAEGGIIGQTWTTGHRNPYGLAFAADGRLWSHEMGPRGGDEFNLIERGVNYGWPHVSNGSQYTGWPIPDHDTRPEFKAPAVYWTPVIAPAGLAFYNGSLFSEWKGSAFIGGLAAEALVRMEFDAEGNPREAERWDMQARIRDVLVAHDGALLLIEDAAPGRLLRLTPAR